MSITYRFTCDQCKAESKEFHGQDALRHALAAGFILAHTGRWRVEWDLAFCSWACAAAYAAEQDEVGA